MYYLLELYNNVFNVIDKSEDKFKHLKSSQFEFNTKTNEIFDKFGKTTTKYYTITNNTIKEAVEIYIVNERIKKLNKI